MFPFFSLLLVLIPDRLERGLYLARLFLAPTHVALEKGEGRNLTVIALSIQKIIRF